jgi:hypothetical protein
MEIFLESKTNSLRKLRSRVEGRKVLVVFFGICTGFALWLLVDFNENDLTYKTAPIADDDVS